MSDTSSLSLQVSFVTPLHSKACLSWLFHSELQLYSLENRMKVSKVWYLRRNCERSKHSGQWKSTVGSERDQTDTLIHQGKSASLFDMGVSNNYLRRMSGDPEVIVESALEK